MTTPDTKERTGIQRAFPLTTHIWSDAPKPDAMAKEIPAAKRRAMRLRTVRAALPVWAVLALGVWLEWHEGYLIGLGVLGAIVMSGQAVSAPLRDVVDQVVRLINAWKGHKE